MSVVINWDVSQMLVFVKTSYEQIAVVEDRMCHLGQFVVYDTALEKRKLDWFLCSVY